MSGSFSTDVNGNRQNPDLRLVDSFLDVVYVSAVVPAALIQRRIPSAAETCCTKQGSPHQPNRILST